MRAIFWFRQDLRLRDNPGLTKAAQMGAVLPIYILDPHLDKASRYWLSDSLELLNSALQGRLNVFQGKPLDILLKLKKEHQIDRVYWNRCYEPWRIEQDQEIKKRVDSESFNGSLLWEPWEVLKQDGTPYKVFTPYFKRGCLQADPPRYPLPKPSKIDLIPSSGSKGALKVSKHPFELKGKVGEEAARQKLSDFIKNKLGHYKEKRDVPSAECVSRLSSHLHFGEISPHEVWHAAGKWGQNKNVESFLSELGWREFSYYLLYHFPHLSESNLQKKFDHFPWKWESPHIERWKKGLTGYPFVDAGMRQLIQEGYMHNRMRMVVGSFLVKNLLIHWKVGMNHFWELLTDADLASNSASWQWVAGSGADAAPYFRIFNPITQGEKFDPEGVYTRFFVPELKNLPIKYLFKPWEAPRLVLEEHGIKLGKTYPLPIVDLKESRDKALEAFGLI